MLIVPFDTSYIVPACVVRTYMSKTRSRHSVYTLGLCRIDLGAIGIAHINPPQRVIRLKLC